MNQGDLHKVWEIKALKRKPAEDEARKILQRIAHQVQPIMRKRRWRVKLLSEFCPTNARLLGLNVGRGVHVKLRLRRPNRDDCFYPYDQVLDTMLHELCHNAHGPHDAKFYKLWDELRKECEELMAKGITGTGQGFDLPGKRLGGFSKQPPVSSLRQTALAAAERRSNLGSLLPSGPRRLGGDSSIMVLSPAQAAAMAAERRLQDDIWCGSQSEEGGDRESNPDILRNIENEIEIPGKSRHDNAGSQPSDLISRKRCRENEASASRSSSSDVDQNFVDLTGNDGTCGAADDLCCAHQRRKFESDNVLYSKSKCHLGNASSSMSSNLTSRPGLKGTAKDTSIELLMWACEICTLLNPPLAPICKLCGSERLKDEGSKFKSWSCKFCTLDNSVELERCSACEQWRYSHGSPVSARAPCDGD
ncbi:DNA-dependent metalloprotease WSS1 [Syzygium oleosum]|uniref:DNA-dependent metalloprotease WSS1 n=1 Tax=Syzygium oleosum TaxID=219896 RepID=UPI0011D2559D|nr:DNA-dependent metalloprotease WSS1 [Syzygium oleosum]XP_030471267.1 DNA-dependent metalloprotease WSS1 [Syzygium oleosum]